MEGFIGLYGANGQLNLLPGAKHQSFPNQETHRDGGQWQLYLGEALPKIICR